MLKAPNALPELSLLRGDRLLQRIGKFRLTFEGKMSLSRDVKEREAVLAMQLISGRRCIQDVYSMHIDMMTESHIKPRRQPNAGTPRLCSVKDGMLEGS